MIFDQMKINLMEDSFTQEEIDAVNHVLKSGAYTQGSVVREFEEKFAEWNGSKYAVMVNSGSSADFLMIVYLKHKYNLQEGDEILVPSVNWPTAVYPIIQNGLSPVFCEVDESFNIDLESIKKMKTDRTRAVFGVHLLGQPFNVNQIDNYCRENNLIFIEDCCESMGAKIRGRKIGNFGLMGSFSFYFGHHMTTIEGGMIVTNDAEIYDSLISMRSHGWIKGTKRYEKYSNYGNKDFLFDMLGYNLRSSNLNAAIGLVQLKKLDESIKKRIENHRHFISKIPRNLGIQKVNLDETSSFSLALLFENEEKRNHMISKLKEKGIESRPIVAGNLLKQPVFQNKNFKSDNLIMANKIHDCGLYLPNNQFIDEEKINYMVNVINHS
tara:strand:- start:668 stop:1813 length:1146 start_codon:yes stop_codon:yes gene_type:complete